ncbi:MAG TPA: glycosyltransferase [Schlesneria sp.]|jgi:UDP-N-acetylglucosamine transferase subunit ALG13
MDPFDRLIRAVDQWVAERSMTEQVFAQIGKGVYHPQSCEYIPFLTPAEFKNRFANARVVVSHAGMGTIITSLEMRKPIVVMPKRASLGEQRNEHQLATVRHFRRSKQVLVADSELELGNVLDQVLAADLDGTAGAGGEASWPADPGLIQFVREFVS